MLRDCEINLPLYYGSKKNKDLMEAVKKYEDVQIALVSVEKGQPSYRIYLLDEADDVGLAKQLTWLNHSIETICHTHEKFHF